MDSIIEKSFEFLLTQGILGFTTFIAAIVAVFLYRKSEASRERYEISLAAERKLNAELQESRLNELRNGLAAVTKATDTLSDALAFVHRRTPA